jgi:hypothetical protein
LECRRVEAASLSLAGCEQHDDPLRLQAPGGEHERVGRGVIEPVRVVDEAEKRAALGRLGEKAQDGDRDEEAVVTSAPL